MGVTMSRVDPRIADKINRTIMPWNVFNGQCLEVELAMVIVSDYECPRNTHALIPLKCN